MLRCEAKLGAVKRIEIQTHLKQFYVDDYEHLHLAVRYLADHNLYRLMTKKEIYSIVS